MFKVLICLGLVSLAASDFAGHEEDHYDPHPEYKFEYSVQDPHTHDIKNQHETRHGDVVKGFYKLKEADGTVREVHYTADHKNGFNAEVHRSGHAQHPKIYGSSSETFFKQGDSSYGGHGQATSSSNNNLQSHQHHHY